MSGTGRVSTIRPAGSFAAAAAIDRVVLDAGDRQRRRIVLTGEKGTKLLLDFEKPVTLRDGDGLVLEDGSIVVVAGQAEALVEISAQGSADLVRLAWHIGNRHTDAQFTEKSFRIRRDHVLEEMVRGLGARTTIVEAPFDPEPAAPHGGGHHHHD
jgi:urease accessory protein